MEETKYVNVEAEYVIKRNLYLEVPSNSTNEEILKKAKTEIVFPHVAVKQIEDALSKMSIRLDLRLDINDWEVIKSDLKIID